MPIHRIRCGWRARAGTIAAAVAIGFGAGAPAAPAATLSTGVSEPSFNSTDAGLRGAVFAEAAAANSDYARIIASWHVAAPTEPADRRDVGDYRWTQLDASVRDAAANGLEPVLTLYDAPPWARPPQSPGYPYTTTPGAWKPNVGAFADFAHVIARRYAGDYPDPLHPGDSLPRVRYYQAWNEANHGFFFSPQWKGRKPVAVNRYKRMLNAAYAQIHAVAASNRVIVAGSAPFGDRPGGWRTRPLLWWRKLLCLKGSLKPAGNCKAPRFDIADHHPIGATRRPDEGASHRDDAVIADYGKLRKIVSAARRHGTLRSKKMPALWATEIWWETKPPDPKGVSLATQARYISQALYILRRAGAEAVFNYEVRDDPAPPTESRSVQGGLYFSGGDAKPAVGAFRFPFWAERVNARKVRLWASAPQGGRLIFEQRAGGSWKPIARRRTGARKSETLVIKRRGPAKLRARIGTARSRAFGVPGS